MNDQKTYWENKIIGWEKTIYSNKNSLKTSLLEKIASRFRGLLKKRLEVTEKLVSPYIKGKTVIDLGCGSGILIEKLLQYEPKKIIGVDIAKSAVKAAKNNIIKTKEGRKVKFICTDVRKDVKILKDGDIIIGVGFIDYFNNEELSSLFRNLKDKKFLFSFPEKIFSVREILHRIYLTLASCPGSYKYSKLEMNSLLKKAGIKNWWYYDKENIRFITNLPKTVES